MIIPEGINLTRKANGSPDKDSYMTPSDTKVIIQNGILLSGIIDKKTIGTSEGGLVHVIFNDYGPEITKKFMNRLQKLVNYWILNTSFTIGIGDAMADLDTKNQVSKIL
jgi:DNA-directed RNA polymerase II subunit RPB1